MSTYSRSCNRVVETSQSPSIYTCDRKHQFYNSNNRGRDQYLCHIGTTKETRKQPHQVRAEPSASLTCPPQFCVSHLMHTYRNNRKEYSQPTRYANVYTRTQTYVNVKGISCTKTLFLSFSHKNSNFHLPSFSHSSKILISHTCIETYIEEIRTSCYSYTIMTLLNQDTYGKILS